MHYLNVAGCGGVVGGAGEGGVGDGVLKGGQSVLVFTVTSSLLTALELLPELRNLLESNGRRGAKTERHKHLAVRQTRKLTEK